MHATKITMNTCSGALGRLGASKPSMTVMDHMLLSPDKHSFWHGVSWNCFKDLKEHVLVDEEGM